MSGFARPHMPQRTPKRFYDLYENATLPLATHKLPPDMMPGIAYFQFGFYNSSSGYVWPLNIARPVPDAAAREMRRSYYASVSWLDFCIGRVLDSLEVNKLKDSTTVVLHGDHGWQLGALSLPSPPLSQARSLCTTCSPSPPCATALAMLYR